MLNLEYEQTTLKSLVTNMQDNFSRVNSEENFKTGTLKLITGRNDPTAFLPLSPRIGAQVSNNKPKENQYLTEEQAKHVYKKIDSGGIINTDTLHQELEQEKQLNRIDDTSRDTNPCKELMVNNAEKIEPLLT